MIDLVLLLNCEYKIVIISNHDVHNKKYKNVSYINLNFKRKISLFIDLVNLYKIFKILKDLKPSLILSITPKIGFIISLLNTIFRYQRIHFFTGQIWYNRKNFKRFFFKFIDKFILFDSNICFVDSKSQLFFLIKEGFNKKKLILINNGSICGVDTSIFKKNELLKKNFKKKYNIDDNTIVIMFMGRIAAEKGFFELINLYKKLKHHNINFKLTIVGKDEEFLLKNLQIKENDVFKDLIIINHSNEPNKILACSDIFILLSKREGFGLSVIQASSCCVPIIATNIVGLQDSIQNNQTGILIKNLNDPNDFNRIVKLLNSKQTRNIFGNKGRNYVIKYFEKSDVINFLKNELTIYLH